MRTDGVRLKASYKLFNELKCCSRDLNEDLNNEAALTFMEEDKIRCNILKYLAALFIVQIQKKEKKAADSDKCEEKSVCQSYFYDDKC